MWKRSDFRIRVCVSVNELLGISKSTFTVERYERVWWKLWFGRAWCTLVTQVNPGCFFANEFESEQAAEKYIRDICVRSAWTKTNCVVLDELDRGKNKK